MHLISTKEPTVKKPEKAVLLVLTSCNNELQLIVYLSPTFDDLLMNIRSHPITSYHLPVARRLTYSLYPKETTPTTVQGNLW